MGEKILDNQNDDPIIPATFDERADEILEATVLPDDLIPTDEVRTVEKEFPRRSLVGALVHVISSSWECLFGLVSLVIGLAIIATIPVVQLLSLGYLLEVSGRMARTGRLSDGFVGVRKAARVGSMVAGAWLVLLPLRFLSSLWYSAKLIDPDSRESVFWEVVLYVAITLGALHILWAWFRGGRLRHFLWPAPIRFCRWLGEPNKLTRASDGLWEFVASLRLGYYFRLGLVGFLGTIVWLLFPVLCYVSSIEAETGVGVMMGLVGGLAFGFVVFHLPFVQAEYAVDGDWWRLFDFKIAWRDWYRAPIFCLMTLVVTLAFALPLYLLKIELTPRQVTYLPSLLFVGFALPSRFMQGWTVARAIRKDKPRRWWRTSIFLMCLGPAFVAAGIYAFIAFFTRYTSWYGAWSLLEQHAFLVPVPFTGSGVDF